MTVQFNKQVISVIQTNTSVTVKTSDGSVYTSHFAVVTLPLGVLKSGSVTFSPPLSSVKQAAIKRVGFGVFNKVALKFSTAFWDSTSFIYNANTQNGFYPVFINWNNVVPGRYAAYNLFVTDTNSFGLVISWWL